jgi:uncharacterized protein
MYVLEVRNAELIESSPNKPPNKAPPSRHRRPHRRHRTVSTNPAGDATAHTYSSYPLPAEMTATDEIIDGKPHIHALMAVHGDRAIAGHLQRRKSTPLSPAPT